MKKIRIYQIDKELDTYGLAFMSYAFFKEKGYAIPPASIYRQVFDGDVGTENIDAIHTLFNATHPYGYKGRSLSMSDIVELYDFDSGEFYICDTFGYKKVTFDKTQTLSSRHDVHICIAAENGSSSGWSFDLEDATKAEVTAFIAKTVTDHMDILLEEIANGNNNISILYGSQEV